MEVSLSPMEARKSPRKSVKSRKVRENVVEIDGVEFVVETEKKKAPKIKQGKKRVVISVDEEDDVKSVVKKRKKRLSGAFEADDEEEEEEEKKLAISRKKGKVSVQESDHLDSDRFSDGLTGFETPGVQEEEDDVEMVKEEEGEDGGLAGSQDDDMLLTQLSGFQTQDTDAGDALETQDTDEGDALETQEQEQEPRIKSRAASSLPIVFGEKVNRIKVLLECEGDVLDLSGDMGAVGRFTVDRRDNELLLDLKGIIYKTTIVPSNTFFVVNVGQTEAKVEAIMSDFVQLREDTNFKENETMVEGTLEGFAFDYDEELDRPAIEKGASPDKIKPEEGADDGNESKKKKLPAKGLKSGKIPAKKAVAGKSKVGGKASSKVKVGKKPTVKATKTKGKK